MKTRCLRTILPGFIALTLVQRAFSASAPAAPPPSNGLDSAFVTIPYSELRALWEASHAAKDAAAEAEQPPPVSYLIDLIDCHIQIGAPASTVDALFEVQSLGTKWQSIPLIAGNIGLLKAETKELALVCEDGYSLLTNRAGKSAVTLHFTTGSESALSGPGALQLKLPSAAVKRLLVSGIPAGFEALINGHPAPKAKDGTATLALPGPAAEVSVEIARPAATPPDQPSRWQIESQVLVRYAEGRLKAKSRIFAHASGGSGTAATLFLPANAGAVELTGDDLADWHATALDDAHRALEIHWKTRGTLDREFAVSYALPQSPLAEQWSFVSPSAPDGDSRSFFVIIPGEGLELKGPGLKMAVESRRLPLWMRSELGGANFVTAEGGPQLSLEAHWLPEIPTAEALINEAKCAVRLVANGGARTEATYAISHPAPLAWKLELPEKVQLLSCTVDGHPVHPLQRAEGTIELDLPAAPAADKGSKPFSTVVFVYTAASAPMDPVSGRISLTLPRTDLFIERLDWNIAIPSVYEPTAVNGNLSTAPAAASGEGRDESLIALRKDLCRGERPAVEIFYQRQGADK